jgi:diguanylate cyclase (GGDEF)-like protein/PAS domain S-box-containing protein
MGVSQILLRRSLPLLLAVLLVAASVIFYAVARMTYTLDRNVAEHSQFLVTKALDHRRSLLKRGAIAIATVNEMSSNPRRLAGMTAPTALYERLDHDVLLSIGPDSKTTWAFTAEPELDTDQRQRLGVELKELLEQTRRAGPGELRDGILRIDDFLVLAVAAPVPSGEQATQGQVLGTTFALLDMLTPDELLQLGFDFGLMDLRVLAEDAGPKEASLAIEGLAGSPALLGWSPPEFGREMLKELLPVVGSSAVLLFLLIGLIASDALKASRRLEDSHSALLQSQASLANSEKRFRDIAEAASDWLWETDAQLKLVYLSERFECITKHMAGQWLGRPLDELLQADGQDIVLWLGAHSGKSLRCHYSDRDGDERICRVASRPIMVEGRCVGYRGTASDITEEVKAQTQVEHLSMHDVLTGLPNRNNLRGFLADKLEATRPLALLSMDLDRFKPVNDTLGHAAGDLVLQEIALRLLSCTRNEDIVARLGGDEFIIVLDGMTSQESIELLCARLIDQLRQPIIYEGQEIFIGGSIGIALAPQDATEANELLRCADIALYQAKEDGRATWRFYASEMNQRLLQKRQLETDLRQAMAAGDMKLQYHPRYRTNGMSMIGAEALVRWQHPQRGLLGPAHFIVLAEETGLIVPLGQWVLNEACKEAARWPEHMVVSVNLSVVQFRQSDLRLDVQRALQGSSLAASRLELEVTESILLDESAGALKTLNSVKELGVRLTMDQFGTGYSSLNYLRSYPFDGLKIDRSFVANVLSSAGDRSIIKAIVGLAQALGITVTAEGVETREQLDWLGEENCAEVQGFHMSKPQSAEDMERLISEADPIDVAGDTESPSR